MLISLHPYCGVAVIVFVLNGSPCMCAPSHAAEPLLSCVMLLQPCPVWLCRNKRSSIGSASRQSWSLRPGNMDDSSNALLRASEYHRERSRLQVRADNPCCRPVLKLCNGRGLLARHSCLLTLCGAVWD